MTEYGKKFPDKGLVKGAVQIVPSYMRTFHDLEKEIIELFREDGWEIGHHDGSNYLFLDDDAGSEYSLSNFAKRLHDRLMNKAVLKVDP